ncbi:MAG: FKBP-type peptidyl-prolyl cis-trans isomerase [Candidatus Nanopelagicales bacterium]
MRTWKMLVPVAALALVVTGCSSETKKAEDQTSASPEACSFDETIDGVTAVQQAASPPDLQIAQDAKPPKDLVTKDLCAGEGVAATPTDTVTVNYVGVGYDSHKVFDSSFERGAPATFPLSGVIPGWTEGVTGMKPGGARLLLIPADMAYGAQGTPDGTIKPNEALAFIVEMDSVGTPSATPASS